MKSKWEWDELLKYFKVVGGKWERKNKKKWERQLSLWVRVLSNSAITDIQSKKNMTFHLLLFFSRSAVCLSIISMSACIFQKTCRDVWVLSNYYYIVDRNLLLLFMRKTFDLLPCSFMDFVSTEMENLISYDRHFQYDFYGQIWNVSNSDAEIFQMRIFFW